MEGYASTVRELTSDRCHIDAVKLWPDDDQDRTEVINVRLKNKAGQYYAGTDENGNAVFSRNGRIYQLKPDNGYTCRFSRVPVENDPDAYTLEEIGDQNTDTKGLVTYTREIICYKVTNDPAGVDLLFVIDHSGSMNFRAYGGNPNRSPSVMKALNGEPGSLGVISEFLKMNEKNQWAAVGFKGPDGSNYWTLGCIPNFTPGPWRGYRQPNAGEKDSEILSADNQDGTDTFGRQRTGVNLYRETESILTNYTAGLWRAEQFLQQEKVRNDGRKKVVIFISDGIPTLYIPCTGGTLANAGTTTGSYYWPDWDGGCPTQTMEQFRSFVNDVQKFGYTFGGNLEFYTLGFGNSMQAESGKSLLKSMLSAAYGEDREDHFMSIDDNGDTVAKLKEKLSLVAGTKDTYHHLVIEDDLSRYVDLYRLSGEGSSGGSSGTGSSGGSGSQTMSQQEILTAAKVKVTMTDPDDTSKQKVLYENGNLVDENNYIIGDTGRIQILKEVVYDASSKTVRAVFNPSYLAQPGITYTLSFDVKASDEAYAQTGYDKDKDGKVIQGDPDTDFLGTDPANATSSNKDGFRSNDEAKAVYQHNDDQEEKKYPHPVIQVSLKILLEKVDQTGDALEGASFQLYGAGFDPKKTLEQNAGEKIGDPVTSRKNQSGKAIIVRTGLQPGTYYLVELSAPEGYTKPEGPVKIVIAEKNGTMTVTASINGKTITAPQLSRDETTGEYDVKITNSAGYELPSTGGSGKELFLLLGNLLVLFGAAGIILRHELRGCC